MFGAAAPTPGMTRRMTFGLVAALLAVGCGETSRPDRPDPDELTGGEAVYRRPLADGNTFTCATCHALSEPAADGIRRPGHPIGDAANRPTYKNGRLTSLRDAVNTCVDEWMGAEPLAADDPRWLDLEAFLVEQAGSAPAAEVTIERVDPPADPLGGDMIAGRDVYHETCVVCHGEEGAGSQKAPPLAGAGTEAPLIAERVRLSGRADSAVYPGLAGGRMPFWGLDRLSERELLDVIAYVEAIGRMEAPTDAGPTGADAGVAMGCGSSHPRVGQIATLTERQHGVGGEVVVVDDCTLEVRGFTFDGRGIDVRFYAGTGLDFSDGFAMGDNLVRSRAYEGETFTVRLPPGRTLDDLDSISVWCIPVGLSFGDGIFE